MKVLFYCYSGLGIGHLTRTLKLADAAARNGDVHLLLGSHWPAGVKRPTYLHVHQLPAVRTDNRGGLERGNGSTPPTSVMTERETIARCVGQRIAPDVLVTEMFPFGRKKLTAEIVGLIEAVRLRAGARVLASVRDILVGRGKQQHTHDQRAADWINRYYDAVLVHGDPSVARLDDTFSAMDRIRVPIHYTGYVAPPAQKPAVREPVVVVSTGGGRVGAALRRTARAAAPAIKKRLGLYMQVIDPATSGQAKTTTDIACDSVGFVPDFAALLRRASLSVSQAGYNTVTDVLATATPSVLVPYEAPTEDEQVSRARLLERRGRCAFVRANALTTASLVDACELALTKPRELAVDLRGASSTADWIETYAR